MRRVYLGTLLTCLVMILIVSLLFYVRRDDAPQGHITVGFIYEDDESTPYTYNFSLAAEAVIRDFPDRVTVISKSNVPPTDVEDPVRDMVRQGCSIIFTSSNSDGFPALAEEFPDVQFCQISYLDEPLTDTPKNYHTFRGELHEGRYVTGVVAGMKLKELIDSGQITPEEAVVGYVGAFPSTAIISGYTAFLLGIHSIVPEAVMKVKYTHIWGNLPAEKAAAEELINSGCVIISHHSDTSGPALACEEAAPYHIVYFVGYNQSMMDVAPTTALISTRINWAPYVTGAVAAVLENKVIEKYVKGHVHGNDMSAGFDRDWVQVLDLNSHVVAPGTAEKVEETIDLLKKGKLQIFKGDYIGVNYEDESDIFDLSQGFEENRDSSSPAFKYILKDYIEIV